MNYRRFDRVKNGIEFLIGVSTVMYIKSSGISDSFVSGNIPDIVYPITNYALARIGCYEKPSLPVAVIIASMGTMAEIAQYFGMYSGTFDIKDIPMYFIGAGIAYGIDRMTFNSKKAGLEEKISSAVCSSE